MNELRSVSTSTARPATSVCARGTSYGDVYVSAQLQRRDDGQKIIIIFHRRHTHTIVAEFGVCLFHCRRRVANEL